MSTEDIIFAGLCIGFAVLSAYLLTAVKKERTRQAQQKK